MKSQIQKISQISPSQSVVCILGTEQIPSALGLASQEVNYAQKQFKLKEEHVFINSYNRCIYLVNLKPEVPQYKVREQLRKAAYKMKKLIKKNNHSELVISSDQAYKGCVEDFAEGLLLSFYTFGKYKSKKKGRYAVFEAVLLHFWFKNRS